MKKHTILGLTALTIILTTACAWATTWYVNSGQSIQDAIDIATHGDTVIVSQGIYYENIFFNGKNIVLTGTDPEDSAVVAATILDGSGMNSVVTFEGSETESCILSGFTIRNGSAHRGAGFYGNGNHAKIQHNIIRNNAAGYQGGGLFNCDGLIQYNIITQNSSSGWNPRGAGGGLLRCDGTIQYNIISYNSSRNGGGLYYCNGTIKNNLIMHNSSSDKGGGLYQCGLIINNTIIYNRAYQRGGGLVDRSINNIALFL